MTPQRTIGTKVTEDLERKIREYGAEYRMTVSDVVKEALYQFFRDNEEADRIESLIRKSEDQIVKTIIKKLDSLTAQ